MATVPVYGGQQVRTAPLQPVFQNTPDVSSGGQALARGMGVIADVADRVDERDAQDEAFKLERQLREDWQVQRSKLREQYKGDQAEQYKVEADKWWEEARAKYSQQARPRALQLASRSIGTYKLAQDADALQYVEGEKRRTREINFRTLQSDLVREAGQTVTAANASTIAASVTARLTENAIRYAAAEGLGSDVGTAMAREQVERFHGEVAISLASKPGGAEAAQKYLSEFGKDIPLGARTRIEEIVTREVDNQFATQFAAQQAGKPLADQLKAAGEIQNPDRREKAIQQIKLNHVMAREALREVEEKFSDQAWQMFSRGEKIPEAVLAGMNGRERFQLQEAQRARLERMATGATVKTDWKTYLHLRERIFKGEKIDLRGYTERIAPAQLEQLVDIQTSTRNPAKAPEAMSQEQQLAAHTRTMGLKDEKLGKFQAAFGQEVSAFIKATGKEPGYDDRQKILDRLTMDVVTHKGILWDSTAPAYTLPADKRTAPAPGAPATAPKPAARPPGVAVISSGDRALITEVLRKKGIVPTEDAIQERYRMAKEMGTVK